MNVELRWLKSFLAVAEEMHFSRAASRLNLAQPALTAQIRQLEEAVGARLFERSNRMGGLTPAGRALLAEARAVVPGSRACPFKVASVGRRAVISVESPKRTSITLCFDRFRSTVTWPRL